LVELVPKAIQLIEAAIENGLNANEVPKNALEATIHVVKGSGTYEERTRTRGDLYVHDGAVRERQTLEVYAKLLADCQQHPRPDGGPYFQLVFPAGFIPRHELGSNRKGRR
jgi:hypothetical protein